MVSNSNNCCKVVITLYGVMDVYSPFGKLSRLPLRVNASVIPCFWNSGFQALVCYFVDVGVIPWVGVIRNLHKRKKKNIKFNPAISLWSKISQKRHSCVAPVRPDVFSQRRCRSGFFESLKASAYSRWFVQSNTIRFKTVKLSESSLL